MIIVTFFDSEEQVVDKIKAVFQVLTIGQIYKVITGKDAVEDYHGIESSIHFIRKKMGHDITQYIRRYGYKFRIEK